MSAGTNPTIAEMVAAVRSALMLREHWLSMNEPGSTIWLENKSRAGALRAAVAALSSLSPLIEAARREAYEDAALTCDNYTSAVDLNASSRFAQSVADELAARIRTLSTFPAPATDWRNEQKVWLWKNGDHFLAYAHEYPCYPNGGDPLTIGEPVGVAILKPSAPPTTSDGEE